MDVSLTREIDVPVGTGELAKIKIDKFLIINVGETAPDFVAKNLDGEPVKLSALRGKVVLLDFWASWCGPCLREFPNIKKVVEEFGADGNFVVVGIALDSDSNLVRSVAAKYGASWTHVAAGPAEVNPVAKAYHVTSVPATFLLDRDGKVVAKDAHGSKLRAELRKLFPGPVAQAVRSP